MAVFTNAWSGRLRRTPWINAAILILSIATFGVAVSYANAAIKTPMLVNAQASALPFLKNLRASRYVLRGHKHSSTCALDQAMGKMPSQQQSIRTVVAAVYFIGWLAQWSIWMNCEISGIGFENGGKGETCWQINIDHRQQSYVPLLSSEGIVNARVGLGAIVMVLYAVYAVLSVLTVVKAKRGGRSMEMNKRVGSL
ncbi:MAG: hypothetical protein Q9183_003426 [Haloplaca sp. 2 TL-2023]